MSYSETLEYLYSRLPMFSKLGQSAIKKDLTNTLTLCAVLDNPHQKFKSIHIAGTNGKGSTSNMLAAILQEAGYKTGLYTSPHLLDFRERIRINGEMISQEEVISFVSDHKNTIEEISPSFFEVTVAMAFSHFAKNEVDIAIIETGLGGRLDSTNVITPILSLITNISLDHTQMLGNTVEAIAREKAGIIKKGVPVVISEDSPLTTPVFEETAQRQQSRIVYARRQWNVNVIKQTSGCLLVEATRNGDNSSSKTPLEAPLLLTLDLPGTYQVKNLKGVLTAVDQLIDQGYAIEEESICHALSRVTSLTGLRGRWQTLAKDPLIICDTGHNEAGWKEVILNLKGTSFSRLHMVIGIMKDKDYESLLNILPKSALYYFCNANFERAMPAQDLLTLAAAKGFEGRAYESVKAAVSEAKNQSDAEDLIFIGGSTFIASEALELFI